MQNINVNIVPDNFPQTIRYSQGDIGRQFKINVTDFEIPNGATVKIQATKPSGFGFSVAGVVAGSSVTFTTTAEMTDEAGRFQAELQITSGDDVIGTANFLMIGERNPHPEGTTDGSQGTIIPELTLLVERVEKAASDILDMEVVATTLPAGSQATYSYDEDLNKATFGIPEGQAGAGAAGVVASAYSAAKTYKVGDYVLYNSNLYRCTTAITTAEAWTAAHWTQIVLADDVSDLKTDLDYTNEFVFYNLLANQTLTDNVFVASGSGEQQSNTSFASYLNVPIPNGVTTLYGANSTATNQMLRTVCFYTSEGVYISGVANVAKDTPISVPMTATKASVTINKPYGNHYLSPNKTGKNFPTISEFDNAVEGLSADDATKVDKVIRKSVGLCKTADTSGYYKDLPDIYAGKIYDVKITVATSGNYTILTGRGASMSGMVDTLASAVSMSANTPYIIENYSPSVDGLGTIRIDSDSVVWNAEFFEKVNTIESSISETGLVMGVRPVYTDFNDFPLNTIISVTDVETFANAPQGFETTGHGSLNSGRINATVMTYSSDAGQPHPTIINQIANIYANADLTTPRIAFRSAIWDSSNNAYEWSKWSDLSTNGVLHSTNKVVDYYHLDYTFDDFNDAEPNAIYQVDLNVADAVANNPSPNNSGVLMTFAFSPVTNHAYVQMYFAKENGEIEMYFRYGYINAPDEYIWTSWKKTTTTTVN